MTARRVVPLPYQSRVWIGVFAAAGVLVTLYVRIIDTLGYGGMAAQASWGMGFAFCLMPLSLAGAPNLLRAMFFAECRRAVELRRAGDLAGALAAYQQQLAILTRHRWLDALRGYIFLERQPDSGLREEVLLCMALIAYDLQDGQHAANYAWRCLGYNPRNAEALALLERIRALPHEGVVGW